MSGPTGSPSSRSSTTRSRTKRWTSPAASGIEFGEAGDYYAKLLAGWNVIPISLTFPITVFVVRNLNALGCSMNVLGDYVIVDREGLETDHITLAHEIGHACGLSPGLGSLLARLDTVQPDVQSKPGR